MVSEQAFIPLGSSVCYFALVERQPATNALCTRSVSLNFTSSKNHQRHKFIFGLVFLKQAGSIVYPEKGGGRNILDVRHASFLLF